jgi:hypothetical protein
VDESSGDWVCCNIGELFQDGLRGAELDDRGLSTIPDLTLPFSMDLDAERDHSMKLGKKARKAALSISDNEMLVRRHQGDAMDFHTVSLGDDSEQIPIEIVHLFIGTKEMGPALRAASDEESHSC